VSSGVAGAVKSPLPGVILSVDCKVGDTVKIRETKPMSKTVTWEVYTETNKD
jgi:hypothetical protein